jgi:hypothetical protein
MEEELVIKGQARAPSPLLPRKELPITPVQKRLVVSTDNVDDVMERP